MATTPEDPSDLTPTLDVRWMAPDAPADIHAVYRLLALHSEAMHAPAERLGFLDTRRYAGMLLKVKAGDLGFLLALRDGKAVGMVSTQQRWSTFAARPVVLIEDLFVLESYRNQRIGERLLEETVRWARVAGATAVEWSVQGWNMDAIRFYERLGGVQRPERITMDIRL
jgi:GNAT superfamily N-acetyltransferase